LNSRQRLTAQYSRESVGDALSKIDEQLNALSEGRLSASYQARSTVPATGSYALGDKVWNSTPAELGTVGGKYIVLGWICVTPGTPGTLKEMRVLTGG
jgi:hypothetical protein